MKKRLVEVLSNLNTLRSLSTDRKASDRAKPRFYDCAVWDQLGTKKPGKRALTVAID